MCKCTPEIRTPYCGKGDCQWPEDTFESPFATRANAENVATTINEVERN